MGGGGVAAVTNNLFRFGGKTRLASPCPPCHFAAVVCMWSISPCITCIQPYGGCIVILTCLCGIRQQAVQVLAVRVFHPQRRSLADAGADAERAGLTWLGLGCRSGRPDPESVPTPCGWSSRRRRGWGVEQGLAGSGGAASRSPRRGMLAARRLRQRRQRRRRLSPNLFTLTRRRQDGGGRFMVAASFQGEHRVRRLW